MINLSKESLLLLEKCLRKHNPSLISVVEDINTTEYSSSFYNQLCQIVCDELVANGFGENYVPNDYGISLEKLIDEIGRLFM